VFNRDKDRSDERGQILVIVAGGLLVFIALVGLVIDTGIGYRARRTLQNASDLAAMAGTRIVADYYLTDQVANPTTGAEVHQAVEASLVANGCVTAESCTWSAEYVRPDPNATGAEIDLGHVTAVAAIPADAQGVRVETAKPSETFFMRAVGIDQIDVDTRATAMTSSLLNEAPTGVLLPIAAFDSDYEAGIEYELTEGAEGPGNFGWLSWTGAVDAGTLGDSICWPDNPELTFPVWIEGATGMMNSRHVRDCLDQWLGTTVLIPIWGQTNTGGGSHLDYEIITLGAFTLTDYDRHANKVNGHFVEFYALPGVPAGYGRPPCLSTDSTCLTRTNFIGLTR
jgi:hypothetical protein